MKREKPVHIKNIKIVKNESGKLCALSAKEKPNTFVGRKSDCLLSLCLCGFLRIFFRSEFFFLGRSLSGGLELVTAFVQFHACLLTNS